PPPLARSATLWAAYATGNRYASHTRLRSRSLGGSTCRVDRAGRWERIPQSATIRYTSDRSGRLGWIWSFSQLTRPFTLLRNTLLRRQPLDPLARTAPTLGNANPPTWNQSPRQNPRL